MLGLLAHDLEMFRRDGVDESHGLFECADEDDSAEIAPGGRGDGRARQRAKLRVDRLLDLIRERSVVRDQDRLGARVVLGLRQ